MTLRNGDIVSVDIDGVASIPHEVVEETVARAFERVCLEGEARAELEAGGYLRHVYARHGVL